MLLTCQRVFLWPFDRNNFRNSGLRKKGGVILQMLVKGISCMGGCAEELVDVFRELAGGWDRWCCEWECLGKG